MARFARSRLAVVMSVLLTVQAATLPAIAQDAKTHLTAGDKAAKAKDWAKALESFEAANKAQPSAEAQEGIASARYQLKQDGEAYEAYAAWLKLYGDKAPKPKKTAVEARLKELGDKTGAVSLDVSEAGAAITVDGKAAGSSPLAGPLRLSAGPHRIRVSKDGFLPYDQVPNVVAGGAASIQVKLEAQANKGRLAVKEKSGQAIRVLVDGVDVGDAPWTGEVTPGEHEVRGRSATLSAPAQKIPVERGKTADVELVAQSATAQLRVVTSDGKGVISVDGKVVGEGSFTSDLPAGAHKVKVSREGFDPFDQEIVLEEQKPKLVSVTLQVSSKIETSAVQKEGRRVEGVYGGFGLMGTLQPGGMGSTMEKSCTAGDKPVELVGCDEGSGVGAGVSGFIGYHWDPVGVELFAAGQYDQIEPTRTWAAASTDPGAFAPDPARTEEFAIRRAGGAGALRVRLTLQGEKLRFSMAAGAGLSYRVLAMQRDTRLTADASQRSAFVPDPQSYLSPVLSVEPGVQYRLGPATAIAVGVTLLLENPNAFDSVPKTPPSSGERIGPTGSGLTTRSYDLATDTQLYVGPFLGMMFGP